MKRFSRPWLRALSALSANLSTAWYGVGFIGPTVAFPNEPSDFLILTMYMIFGTLFLLLTVLAEKEFEQ